MINKNVFIVIIIAVLAGAAIFFLAPNNSQAPVNNNSIDQNDQPPVLISGPSIKVEPDSFDLGTVIYGDVPERTFMISNIGDEPLEISKLATSCGCTKASVADKDKIIAPGQSIDMVVTFDPAVHKDNSDLGELTRIIYIKSNDPKQPEVEVEIAANVIRGE